MTCENKKHARGALAFVLFAVLAQVPANDHDVYLPPDVPRPALGESYVDPVFGTTVTRITDVASQFPGVQHVTPEYAQLSVFNVDDTYVLLRPTDGSAHLFTIDGTHVRSIPAVYEPRWSRENPDWIYHHSRTGRQIARYDIARDSQTLIADYSKAGPGKSQTCSDMISFGGGQSDVSDNERINIVCDDRYGMVVDLTTGTDFGVADLQGGIDYTTLAMDGETYVVGYGGRNGTGQFVGMQQYDKDGTYIRQLLSTAPHLGMGRNTDGSPVAVVATSNAPDQPAPPNFDWNGIAKIDLDDGTITLLLGLIEVAGNNLAAKHFAGRGGDGWMYVGNYRWPREPAPDEWKGYDQEIFRIQMVKGQAHRDARVERLVHMRNSSTDYYATSLFSVSMSGEYVAFPSDWRNGDNGVDTYLFKVSPERR